MGLLDEKVAIVTGAGGGSAARGNPAGERRCDVIVNDVGGSLQGEGDDRTPAQEVVDTITAAGAPPPSQRRHQLVGRGEERVDQAVEGYGSSTFW